MKQATQPEVLLDLSEGEKYFMAASVEPHSTADSIINEIEVILILGLVTGSVDIASENIGSKIINVNYQYIASVQYILLSQRSARNIGQMLHKTSSCVSMSARNFIKNNV